MRAVELSVMRLSIIDLAPTFVEMAGGAPRYEILKAVPYAVSAWGSARWLA